jgi:hypothetical protein
VICRIFHKAVDPYSKLMMVKTPYYHHPMDPSTFVCFQQETHAALPLPNPSCYSDLAHALPFHHGLENQHHQVKSNDNNGGHPPAACSLEPNGISGANMCSSATVPMLPPFPSFAGKATGVNAGPPEPPTWMDGCQPHSGFFYEMDPPAAPRGA